MDQSKDYRIIFIDTSEFESNNFFESSRIKQLFQLCEQEEITILLPEITYKEVINRAFKNIDAAGSKLSKFHDDTRIFRNLEVHGIKSQLVDIDAAKKEFTNIFDSIIKKSKIEKLGYPTGQAQKVFEKYFNDEFPFSSGKKKYEFPDAFAILTVEEWCEKKKKNCLILTRDKDFEEYNSEHIIGTDDIASYIDKTLRFIELEKKQSRINNSLLYYAESKKKIETQLSDWLYDEIDNFNFYDSYFDVNVHDIDIKNYSSYISDSPNLISVTDHEILLEGKAAVKYKVEVEIDDENSFWYDNEDKITHYMDTTTEVMNEEEVIYFKIKVYIEKEIPISFELDEINNGKQLDTPYQHPDNY